MKLPEIESYVDGADDDPGYDYVLWSYLVIAIGWLWKKIFFPVFSFILNRIKELLASIWNGFLEAIRKLLGSIGEAIGRKIGWAIGLALIIGFTMSFTANGYSLSKTFSWEGIKTLVQTFE